MAATSSGEISFRGIPDRNLNDQVEAMAHGYNSVTEYAVDLLARRVIALEQRVAALDGQRGIEGDPED